MGLPVGFSFLMFAQEHGITMSAYEKPHNKKLPICLQLDQIGRNYVILG